MKFLKRQMILWLLPMAWASFIFWLSKQSDVPEPDIWMPPFADKLIHAVIYAILSCSLYPAIRSSGTTRWHAASICILLASLFGITDEWHQSMVINRTPDFFDWVADTVGACFVFLLARFTKPEILTADGR